MKPLIHRDFSPEELAAFRKAVARKIVSMRLGVPAVVMLEASLPLAFASSQLLVALAPFLETFAPGAEGLAKLRAILENRDELRKLIADIEQLEEGEDHGPS